ncbi:pentatricopeptide repeat-containing protein At4g39530 [Aristolochia californica]|uniref:pentatricopeptide repeat-containing protein At4g39530 n=1 Tax=Aristolochia californica TaxID=171875 RepID=UPI0035DED773
MKKIQNQWKNLSPIFQLRVEMKQQMKKLATSRSAVRSVNNDEDEIDVKAPVEPVEKLEKKLSEEPGPTLGSNMSDTSEASKHLAQPLERMNGVKYVEAVVQSKANERVHNSSIFARESSEKRREFAHLLQCCISCRPHIDFRSIHGHIVLSGLHSDIFINNLLLNGYSKSGSLSYARGLFDTMPQKNLISWASMISAYNHHGNGEGALVLFYCFRGCSSERANEFILASVLRACCQLKAINQAAQVHAFAIKTSFDSNIYVGTALVDVYSKNGDMEEAKLIFYELPVKNVFTWTTIITGYSQSGDCETSLQLFNQMKDTDFQADRYVLSSVISACSMLGFLDGGKQIHGYVLRSGAEADISVINVLMDFYSKCHKLAIARKIFDHIISKNVISWTTMIAGYMQNGCDLDALQLFLDMNQQGWYPDGFTCTSILTSCGSLGALEQGKQVHCYTIKANLETDDFVKNGLIDMYAKCDALAEARTAFDLMAVHNVISYNAMIEGYSENNELLEAVNLFKRMRTRLFQPSLLTFMSLLGVSASLLAVDLSKQIHGLVVKFGISVDLYAGSCLVDVYSKCSCLDDARLVFEGMDERDIVVWNAMMFGYAQNFQSEMAPKLFLKLQLEGGMKPNNFTFVALVTSASNLANLVLGLQFHNQIIKIGFELEPYVSNALMDMYAKCGSVEEARKLFDAITEQDVVCWNSMICTYAQHGHAAEALEMFQRMKDEHIQPNYITFIAVLSACSHAGLVDEGLKQFNSMKDEFGIEPGMDHYASIVALFGRSGKLQEAKEFIGNMPIVPAAVVWRSFLGACRLAGDVDLGKYAAKMAISIEPKDSGSYVLLSNLFASKGMWADVEKVRKSMNTNRVIKEPGHSWIEVKGDISVFIARDKAHGEVDMIYFLLEKLTKEMRDAGYMPDYSADYLID